jgi:(E)-4-hydroxy-3-methylbut-2-enyl-diphosphate synthase
MKMTHRDTTIQVMVGGVPVGGGAPVVVQSMTNTDTENADATAAQILELAAAGSELVRITVNTPKAAERVPEIVRRVRGGGSTVPVIGDFHYNGHKLLADYPECAAALDKYRINPGNVGKGSARDEQFASICAVARDLNKAVRIGVNSGSLNEDLVADKMLENSRRGLGKSSAQVMNECMIISALQSTELALECGLRQDQIIISCKTSRPTDLIDLYRDLAAKTRQPLHLGLTEAGMGVKGLVWSASAMGVLLAEGIGDTIRVSLTPTPGGDRCEEVCAAQELLQSLGLRQFSPCITACPGCGRTSSNVFQQLTLDTQAYVRRRISEWGKDFPGVERLHIAVMGCIVNGPGESRTANIGISLPGNGESPNCPVYADGQKIASLSGTPADISARFLAMLEEYVKERYQKPE